jgi:MarR family transcriptional regulator, lower aerobic nicotinate degradation pathway regulator
MGPLSGRGISRGIRSRAKLFDHLPARLLTPSTIDAVPGDPVDVGHDASFQFSAIRGMANAQRNYQSALLTILAGIADHLSLKRSVVMSTMEGMSLARSTGVMMGQASELFDRIAERTLQPFGLRPKEFAVLTAIDAMGARSQQSLAHSIGIDRTTMVSVVDRLERGGLVTRARDASDRRKYAIELTERGRTLLHSELNAAMLVSLDEFLHPLAPDEREEFHRLLGRLVNDRDPVTGRYGTGQGSAGPGGAG